MLKLYVAAKSRIQDLKEKKDGATMIEYSLLIGLITVVVVVLIGLVGDWILAQWTALEAAL